MQSISHEFFPALQRFKTVLTSVEFPDPSSHGLSLTCRAEALLRTAIRDSHRRGWEAWERVTGDLFFLLGSTSTGEKINIKKAEETGCDERATSSGYGISFWDASFP